MKTVVLERNAYGRGQHRLHAGLLEFSRDLLCGTAVPTLSGEDKRQSRALQPLPAGEFLKPAGDRLQAHVTLDVVTANVEVLKWLRDVGLV